MIAAYLAAATYFLPQNVLSVRANTSLWRLSSKLILKDSDSLALSSAELNVFLMSSSVGTSLMI